GGLLSPRSWVRVPAGPSGALNGHLRRTGVAFLHPGAGRAALRRRGRGGAGRDRVAIRGRLDGGGAGAAARALEALRAELPRGVGRDGAGAGLEPLPLPGGGRAGAAGRAAGGGCVPAGAHGDRELRVLGPV